MATIREIAERAGVSLGTVDRVLHQRGRVSPETAARIREVIAELDFTPNLFARNLSTSREYRIGVLMPELGQDEGYWNLPWKGMQRAAESLKAYRLSIQAAFFDRYKPETFIKAHRKLIEAGVDGILMAPVLQQAARQVLDLPDNPVHICFDTGLDHPAVHCQIGQDSKRSGCLAGRLMTLINRPGATVAIILPDTDNQHIAQRAAGFREACLAGKLQIASIVRPQRTDLSSLSGVLDQVLGEHPEVAGFLLADSTTHLAAQALEKRGRTDLTLIGYDLMAEDVPYLESGLIDFLITQSPLEQGEIGIRQLFNTLVLNAAVEPLMRTPLNIVTRENYQDFLEKS